MRGFSLDATSPDAFATTSPAEGARTQNSRPDLSWQASADSGPGGLAGYDVVLDGLTVASPGPATTTFTPATALADGTHDWHVIARDGVGNPRSSGNATFRVDTTAPSARFSIAPNPALVGRTVAFDAGASSDAGGPVTRYEWDLDGDGTFETDTGAIATASRAYALPQTITVQLRVTDALGLTGVGSAELRVTELPVDRNLFGVTVNHGAQFTNTPKVTVTAKFPAATTQILVSNDGGFDAPATFGPQADIPWQLDSSGPERLPKTIYVRFLNGQAISETYQDDIILDEIPPVVQQAAIVPAGAAARVQAAKVRKWAVKLKASDSNSGVDRVQITTNRKKAGKLLAYKRKLTVTSTTRPKYLRARDRAGNFSGWKKIR
jgi:hypothetical protein